MELNKEENKCVLCAVNLYCFQLFTFFLNKQRKTSLLFVFRVVLSIQFYDNTFI